MDKAVLFAAATLYLKIFDAGLLLKVFLTSYCDPLRLLIIYPMLALFLVT